MKLEEMRANIANLDVYQQMGSAVLTHGRSTTTYSKVEGLLEKLLVVAEAATYFTDDDYLDIMGSRSKGEVERLKEVLSALEME